MTSTRELSSAPPPGERQKLDPAAVALCRRTAEAMQNEIGKALVGQDEVVHHAIVALLSGGHVLIEGLPGLGKTLLTRALATAFGGRSTRLQFTPDLMPADVVGHVLYDLRAGGFRVHRGPVFTNLLLADEINRAPAKTQAALLEVMQEQRVTLEGTAMPLEPPFMTIATQNPLEHEGTYPLPDAQIDRFLLKILIGYPSEAQEIEMVQRITEGRVGDSLYVGHLTQVAQPADVVAAQQTVARLHVEERVVAYAVAIVRATRQWLGLAQGAGPRGALALMRAGRAAAMLAGRDYVVPDDIKQVALPALRHRVRLAPEAELEGQSTDDIVRAVVASIKAPRA